CGGVRDIFEVDSMVFRQAKHWETAKGFKHSFNKRAVVVRSIFRCVTVAVRWRWNCCFHDKGAGDANDSVCLIRSIYEDFFFGRFLVGEALKRNVWYNSTDLITLSVLLSLILKPATYTSCVIA